MIDDIIYIFDLLPLFLIKSEDDITSNNTKFDPSLPTTMNNNTGVNVSNFFQPQHQPSNSNTSLLVFENCGSASAIEELNFSVLHNVRHQSNLSSETRKMLKKR